MMNPSDTDAIAKIAACPSAAVLAADLPAVLGLSSAETIALVVQLVDAGDLLTWSDHPDGESVILSTDAAASLGLELVQVFRRFDDTPTFRWLPPNSVGAKLADRKARRAVPHLESELRDRHGNGGFDDLADENAADTLRDDLIDERRRLPLRHADTRPRLLLGLSWIWPVEPMPDGSCRVCGHLKTLESYAVCLRCLRSGSDSSLAEVAADERPRPATPVLHDDGLTGGRGKAEPRRDKAKPKGRKGKKAS